MKSFCVPHIIVVVVVNNNYNMLEVLGPSLHQESFPPEIDVYRVPHNRMKQLVTSMMQILPEIQVKLKMNMNIYENIHLVVTPSNTSSHLYISGIS